MSGGQRAQLALTLAISKRPELLVLDEPVGSLDPLARRQFLQDLSDTVSVQQLSVVLSSHLVADLSRVCSYLIVLGTARVQVAGDVGQLLANHYTLTRLRRHGPATVPPGLNVVHARRSKNATKVLVRASAPVSAAAWRISRPSLKDLVLGYMSQTADGSHRDHRELEA